MTETTFARIVRAAPWIGGVVATIGVGLLSGSTAPLLWGFFAVFAIFLFLFGAYQEGGIATTRRRMVVWSDAPPGESGPRVSIPWHVARALHANEWVSLPLPPIEGAVPGPRHRIVRWLLGQQRGVEPMWCPTCEALKVGYPADAKLAHLTECTRGRAIETLRVCMEHAAAGSQK